MAGEILATLFSYTGAIWRASRLKWMRRSWLTKHIRVFLFEPSQHDAGYRPGGFVRVRVRLVDHNQFVFPFLPATFRLTFSRAYSSFIYVGTDADVGENAPTTEVHGGVCGLSEWQ